MTPTGPRGTFPRKSPPAPPDPHGVGHERPLGVGPHSGGAYGPLGNMSRDSRRSGDCEAGTTDSAGCGQDSRLSDIANQPAGGQRNPLNRLLSRHALPVGGWAGSEPFPEPVIFNGSDGFRIGTREKTLLWRPPTERKYRNVGELAAIPSTTIVTSALRDMDMDNYLWVLDVIESEGAFLEHLIAELPSSKKPSRFMIQHAPALTGSGLLVPPSTPLNYTMGLFTTPKKNGTLRLVQDDRPINAAFERPPEMDLPDLLDFVHFILRHEWVGQADAKAYFYQFMIAEEIRKYFGVRMTAGRGSYLDLVMTRLPMGFSWAPCIAQRCSNVLIRDLGRCWVDNFVVVGRTVEEYQTRRTEFLRRAEKVNLQLDNTEMAPSRRTVVVGLELDLEKKTYRMDPVWVTKVVPSLRTLLSSTLTARQFYEVMGSVVWQRHATRRPLCALPSTFQYLGQVSSAISREDQKWDELVQVPEVVLSELYAAVDELEANKWVEGRQERPTEAEVWTDASSTHYAWLVIADSVVRATGQGEVPENQHIFYSELRSAIDAIVAADKVLTADKKGGGIRIHVDNAPAAKCLQRRISTNFTANRWLSTLPDRQLDVVWVPSHEQQADKYTRLVPGLGTLRRTPPVGSTWMPSRDEANFKQHVGERQKGI